MVERWSVDPKVAGSNLVIHQFFLLFLLYNLYIYTLFFLFIKMQGSRTSRFLLKYCRKAICKTLE